MGYRLAVAGMNQAYGDSSYPPRGPRPSTADGADNGDGTVSVSIFFSDGTFSYNPTENSGFYVCSLEDYDQCDATPGSWELVRQF